MFSGGGVRGRHSESGEYYHEGTGLPGIEVECWSEQKWPCLAVMVGADDGDIENQGFHLK